MRKHVHLLAGAAAFCLTATGAYAMPMSSGALKSALDATNLVEQSALYVVGGRRYCFYFDGWHGAGWYRCGFAFRRGLGWGGVYGWQGWDYGPAARRFGHNHRDFRFREGRRDGDFRDGRRGGTTTFREGTTTRERSTTRGESNFRSQFQQGNEGRQGRSERSSGFSERSGGNMRMQAQPRSGGEFRGGSAPTTSGSGGAQLKSGGAPGGGARGGAPGGAPGGGAPGGGDKK